MIELETQRLWLRPITLDDLDALAQLWRDSEVMRYLPTGKPRPLEATRAELTRSVENWTQHGFGPWVLMLKEQREFIGYCGLQYFAPAPDAELLYALARAYWGRGLGSEAVIAVLRHGFEVVGLDRVVAAVVPENIASRRILEKMGMKLTEDVHHYGDAVIYFALTRDDFEERSAG